MYKDVKTNSDYAREIAAVTEAGIFKGRNGKFEPTKPISRDQMATVIVQAFDLRGNDSTINLIDFDKVDSSHRDNVKILAQNGVSIGKLNKKGERYFDASAPLKRVHFAVFLEKAMKSPAHISAVTDSGAKIAGRTYRVSDALKGILSTANNDALKGAQIDFTVADGQIVNVKGLKIIKSGSAEKPILINGGNSQIDGNVTVHGNNVSLQNLKVAGDLILNGEGFQGKGLDITGKTIISDMANVARSTNVKAASIDPRAAVFEDSNLGTVEINKDGAILELTGNSSVKEINVSSDATIKASANSSVPTVNITDKDVKLTLGEDTKIENITLPEGTKINDVIKNYDAVKGQIVQIDGTANPDAPTPGEGDGNNNGGGGDTGSGDTGGNNGGGDTGSGGTGGDGGSTVTFTPSTNNSTANTTDVLGLVGTEVSSADENIATAEIDPDGNIAIKSVKAGSTTITVKDQDGNSATIPVIVKDNGDIELGQIDKYKNEATDITLTKAERIKAVKGVDAVEGSTAKAATGKITYTDIDTEGVEAVEGSTAKAATGKVIFTDIDTEGVEAVEGSEAEAATGAITYSNIGNEGSSVTIAGKEFVYGTDYNSASDLVTAISTTEPDLGLTANEVDGVITLTAKTAGIEGNKLTYAINDEAAVNFTGGKAAVEAVDAVAAGKVTVAGKEFVYGTDYNSASDLVTAINTTEPDLGVTANEVDGVITLTAETTGIEGNNLTYAINDEAAVNFTGGKAAVDAVDAVDAKDGQLTLTFSNVVELQNETANLVFSTDKGEAQAAVADLKFLDDGKTVAIKIKAEDASSALNTATEITNILELKGTNGNELNIGTVRIQDAPISDGISNGSSDSNGEAGDNIPIAG
ncbi:S-layer homology domain-containing protein [Aciduricibacillus chroicocephali]|uniref:S-layer homology domain-containing protein n=1 Tax=Aciduricibacillus chroicocephali TaxID=3054939 RepID=A0ABY9KUK3_9BACI|nr:S-layer homology domain-containing protein [Bacillaceae bacterium 44XB]